MFVRQRLLDFCLQFGNTLSAIGDERNHRHTQAAAQFRPVDRVAVISRHINHVQRKNSRISEFDDLRGEIKIPLKVRRIDDNHHQFERRNFGHAMEEHITRNLLIERLRAQAVSSRQIEDSDLRLLTSDL